LKVKIEFEDKKFEFEGDVEEVYKELNSFFNKIIPTYKLARDILVSIDVNDLVKIVKPYLRISITGEMIFTEDGESLSMSNKIIVLLIGAKILRYIGKRKDDALLLHEIAKFLSSTSKSTSSRLSELYSKGYIDKCKTDEGVKYKITLKGIIYFSRRST